MPKTSKIKSVSTKPSHTVKEVDERKEFYCCRCKHHWNVQKSRFPASQSPIYRGNNGYLTICNNCIDELFDHYKAALGDEAEALKRICLKFDIYWHKEIYAMLSKTNTSQSRVRAYISKANLYKYVGKTFDDTLDEEHIALLEGHQVIESIDDISEANSNDDLYVDPEIIAFWGIGFDKQLYLELDRKYKQWTADEKVGEIDKGKEAIYKQACILEATINRDVALGKNIETKINTLNTLLGSANLKPVQNAKDEVETEFLKQPFGCGIGAYENIKPIPTPDPALQDVDGIVKYILSWFVGHIAKMFGLKGLYTKLYEKELDRLRVENPQFEDEDDEALFDDLFGGDL